jgi:hypothetical protein
LAGCRVNSPTPNPSLREKGFFADITAGDPDV